MKIFAYGSNMNLNRLKARVPSANKISNGYIEGYELRCIKRSTDGSGKATVLKTDNNENKVWGVVFEINEKEKSRLDRAEGLGYGYNESIIQVRNGNEVWNAQIYIADKEAIDENLIAYNWYKAFIVNGALENKLPENYCDGLKKIGSMQDKNDERRIKNEKILKGE
ncbi:MAG: gamma-glutamylcyclotransferase [Lewinellaceae bacterium]|nr:gamma-glutamylcyclotransferase [Lewinellaceae bacterium]